MRRIVVAALLTATAASPALANEQKPFAGFYANGLLGWDRVQTSGVHGSGIDYGIGGGYDIQTHIGVIGLEAEATDTTAKDCDGASTAISPGVCLKTGRDLYVGGRFGTVIADAMLLYLKGGYANTRTTSTEDDGAGQYTLEHRNLNGARIGGGAEYTFGRHLFLKTEYRYSRYKSGTASNQALAGFGFRFR